MSIAIQGLDHVAISGFYVGTFTNDLFDIPANRQSVKLRYNEMHRLENGKISYQLDLGSITWP